MKYYTCERQYVTAHHLNVQDKHKMHLVKSNVKGKYDDEIITLCPHIRMTIIKRVGARYKDERNQYIIRLQNSNGSMTIDYNCGTGIDHEPTLTDVIWSLTIDASMLDEYLDVDEFLCNMGYDNNIESVRKGEQIWRDIVKQTKELRRLRIPLQQLQELLQDY